MGNNWKLDHVGVAVRNLDKALEYYQSLGIATFKPERGEGIEVRDIQIGSITFEVCQKESISEGIDHIAFAVGDLDKETAKLAEKGVAVIHGGKDTTGARYAFFDTHKVGNVPIELMQRPK